MFVFLYKIEETEDEEAPQQYHSISKSKDTAKKKRLTRRLFLARPEKIDLGREARPGRNRDGRHRHVRDGGGDSGVGARPIRRRRRRRDDVRRPDDRRQGGGDGHPGPGVVEYAG